MGCTAVVTRPVMLILTSIVVATLAVVGTGNLSQIGVNRFVLKTVLSLYPNFLCLCPLPKIQDILQNL